MANELTFTVAPRTVVVAAVQGLADDDKLLVEYQASTPSCPGGDDGVWISFSPGGCQWSITHLYNPKVFDTPGAYRLVFEGAPNQDPLFGLHATIVDL